MENTQMHPINIPIQMMAVTDRNGRVTPIWFRFETADHQIEKVVIEKVLSRDESNRVGIREKRFICLAAVGEEGRLLELRYHVENQSWRIFQFLC